MFVVAVGLFSFVAAAAAHHTVDVLRLVFLLAGVACAFSAVGAANDYCDRELDFPSRTDKPLVQGLVTPSHAVALACVATAAMIVLLAPLGLLTLVLAIVIEALGMAYNVWLKRTPASGIPMAAWFPLIPLLAWSVFGRWQAFLPWLFPVGAALGLEMNVANTLPDLDDDLKHGVHGLAHTLGKRGAFAFAWGMPVLVVGLLWTLALTGAVPTHLPGLIVATVAGLGSTAVAAALVIVNPGRASLRRAFIVQAWGAVALGTGWLASVAF